MTSLPNAIEPEPVPRALPAHGRVARELICEAVRRACRRSLGGGLHAAVLTGSLARDEASFVAGGGSWALLGDAEFLLVLKPDVRLPTAAWVEALSAEIERDLAGRRLSAHVSLAVVHDDYLRRLRPSIFAYELRACGQVVSGDEGALGLIPAFTPAEIPLEDAWRLLCNRLVEHLDAFRRQCLSPSGRTDELRYSTVKLNLDLATSLLVFLKAYEPGYVARARRLAALARGNFPGDALPFPIAELSGRVEDCTHWKLNPGSDLGGPWTDWEASVALARRLWRWELERMTGVAPGVPDDVLWARWMRQQRPWSRVRGWLHVARAQGWHRGWRHWPRWVRLSWRSSPRYCVYAAATKLLFGVFTNMGTQGPEPAGNGWDRVLRRLPVTRDPAEGRSAGSGWHVVEEVAWNYHRFLVPTRS